MSDDSYDLNEEATKGGYQEASTGASEDPYSPENIGVIQFIQLSRIYDTLMAILTQSNPEVARDLLQHHAEGRIVTPGPYFEGIFMSDDNTDENGRTN